MKFSFILFTACAILVVRITRFAMCCAGFRILVILSNSVHSRVLTKLTNCCLLVPPRYSDNVTEPVSFLTF